MTWLDPRRRRHPRVNRGIGGPDCCVSRPREVEGKIMRVKKKKRNGVCVVSFHLVRVVHVFVTLYFHRAVFIPHCYFFVWFSCGDLDVSTVYAKKIIVSQIH